MDWIPPSGRLVLDRLRKEFNLNSNKDILYSLRLLGYTPSFIVGLHQCLDQNRAPTLADLNWIKSSTDLIPFNLAAPMSWAEFRRVMTDQKPKSHQRISLTNEIKTALNMLDFDAMEDLIPFRTKTDRSIRRSRIRDAITIHKNSQHNMNYYIDEKTSFSDATDLISYKSGTVPRKHDWKTIVEILLSLEWDYISITNVLYADVLLSYGGFSWFDHLDQLGAWTLNLLDWTKYMSTISTNLKVLKTKFTFSKFRLFELATLSGYRNPPFPGFDYAEEVSKLAESGTLTHEIKKGDFSRTAHEVLDTSVEVFEQEGLLEWIRAGSWVTSGSSSMGRLEWVDEGKSIKIKAKKNIAAEILDLELLGEETINYKIQENSALLKAELAKGRVAVANDLRCYLQQTWLISFLDHRYKEWIGSTIEERPSETIDRMCETLKLSKTMTSLPFDYAGFDRQPTMEEVITIVTIVLENTRRCVPLGILPQFDLVAQNTLLGFRNATLSYYEKEKKYTLDIKGGVMSGLRWTTLIGNAWNSIMTKLAIKAANMIGRVPEPFRYIRGDDSAIFTPNWSQSMAIKLGYDLLNVLSSKGKYSIRNDATEFLRVWYEGKATSYASRAIPNITQRKPWNPEPWDEVNSWKSMYEALSIVTRRVGKIKISKVWQYFSSRWAQLTHLPSKLLSIPVPLGGYGVGEWFGDCRTDKIAPRVKKKTLEFENLNGRYAQEQNKNFQNIFNITLDQEEANNLERLYVTELLSGDDIPQYSRGLRDSWKSEVRRWKGRVYKIDKPGIHPGITLHHNLLSSAALAVGSYQYLSDTLDSFKPNDFGSFTEEGKVWKDAQLLKQVKTEFRPSVWFAENSPNFWLNVKRLQKQGFDRSEAIDWLTGELWLPETTVLNDLFRSLIIKAVVGTFSHVKIDQLKKKRDKNSFYSICSHYYYFYEHALVQSPLYTGTGMW